MIVCVSLSRNSKFLSVLSRVEKLTNQWFEITEIESRRIQLGQMSMQVEIGCYFYT